jgi:hypothetical protein
MPNPTRLETRGFRFAKRAFGSKIRTISDMHDLVKIQFYDPVVGCENLWPEPLPNGFYRIESIPFFIYGISLDDIVSARPDADGWLQFLKVQTHSPNRTLRARSEVFDGGQDKTGAELLAGLDKLGCKTEVHKQRLVAINVPFEADLKSVMNFLTSSGIQWEHANPTYDAMTG